MKLKGDVESERLEIDAGPYHISDLKDLNVGMDGRTGDYAVWDANIEKRSDAGVRWRKTAREIDNSDGTDLQGIGALVDQIAQSGKPTSGGQRHYNLSKTSDVVKGILKGEYFTIKTGVILDHLGKDADHDISAQDWVNISEALHDPLVIARYSIKRKDGTRYYPDNSYRVWVEAMVNGHWTMVGVEVKSPAKDIAVNAVSTAYGDEFVSLNPEDVLYSRGNGEGIRTLLNGPNPRQYSESLAMRNIVPQSPAEGNGENANVKRHRVTPAEDFAYMDAVKRGDAGVKWRRTVPKDVEEAVAKAAQSGRPVVHVTYDGRRIVATGEAKPIGGIHESKRTIAAFKAQHPSGKTEYTIAETRQKVGIWQKTASEFVNSRNSSWLKRYDKDGLRAKLSLIPRLQQILENATFIQGHVAPTHKHSPASYFIVLCRF